MATFATNTSARVSKMMLQAVIALTVLVLLVGRAVNILGPATPATTPAASPTP